LISFVDISIAFPSRAWEGEKDIISSILCVARLKENNDQALLINIVLHFSFYTSYSGLYYLSGHFVPPFILFN